MEGLEGGVFGVWVKCVSDCVDDGQSRCRQEVRVMMMQISQASEISGIAAEGSFSW